MGLASDVAFYTALFAPLEKLIGKLDRDTLMPIVGFDAGGPLSFVTKTPASGPRTYVSCELAVRSEQVPSADGRYELLATSSDEHWVRSVLTDIGRMSFEAEFGSGHTLDIGPWCEPGDVIQGVVFDTVCSATIKRKRFAVLRVVGVTREELELARASGVDALVAALRDGGVFPHTITDRRSVITRGAVCGVDSDPSQPPLAITPHRRYAVHT